MEDFSTISETDKQLLRDQLLAQKREAAVNEKLDALIKQADIEIFIPELTDTI